jgi:hypothetical protein
MTPRLTFASRLSMLTVSLLLAANLRADTAVPSAITPTNAPKSVFTDDPSFGKDPFFPKSPRRKFVAKAPDERPPDPTVPEFITLRGISSVEGRKLAIINNYTVGEGEEFLLKHNGQPLKVQCLEIKEKSVIINSSGATKEIFLRSAVQ